MATPLEIGDVIQIQDQQRLQGKDIVNIFFYVVELLDGYIYLWDVLQEFKTFITDKLAAIQAVDLNHYNLRADNLTNGLDFIDVAIDVDGTDAVTDVLPTHIAGTYRLGVSTKVTRPGSKRFSGIPIGRVTDNVYTPNATADVTLKTNLKTALSVVVSGQYATCYPVIVGRNLDGTLNLAKLNKVTSILRNDLISSQVSRKITPS